MRSEAWAGVNRELERWRARGLTARLWVRDDDAVEPTAQLERLESIARGAGMVVGLAVIPGNMMPSLLPYLDARQDVFFPMCHGWRHVNHGAADRPSEFGSGRVIAAAEQDAAAAWRSFTGHFGAAGAVFVPPFGDVDPRVVAALPRLGFKGYSNQPDSLERIMQRLAGKCDWLPGVRLPRNAVVPRVDVHVDLIDWSGPRVAGEGRLSRALIAALRLRRKGFVSADEPIGLLTHHLVHDEGIWTGFEQLVSQLAEHPCVRFADVRPLFGADRTAAGTPVSL